MIIILTQCFPSRIGGIETLISNLALNLSKNYKIIVFADRHNLLLDSKYDKSVKDNFIVRRSSGLKFFRRRKKIKELKPFIFSKEIECIIGDSWKSFELCIDLLNNNKIPTICLAHGNEILQKNPQKIKKIKEIFNKCNSIVTNSNYTLKIVKEYGINKPILKRIYPAATNLDNINQSSNIAIQGNPIILTLARLEKRKGHINIINSIEKLKDQFKDIKYIIAGTGSELTYLKSEVVKKRLENNIIFLGNINESEKKYIFSIADLMVMPTLDESEVRSIEGFGIVYIESAFFGIPSIATNVGGTSEAVLNNVTGIVLNKISELDTVLQDLLTNKKKLFELGQKAKKRALEEFQWNTIIEEYISLISSIKIK